MRFAWAFLIQAFYQRNAGFVALLFLFGFGILRMEEHRQLVRVAQNSPVVFGLYLAVWLLYTGKALFFLEKEIGSPAYDFLQHLRLWPFRERMGFWISVVTGCLQPILGYGVFVFLHGLGHPELPLAVVVSLGLCVLVPVFVLDHRLQNQQWFTDAFRLPGFLKWKQAVLAWLHFPWFLWAEEKMLLFSSKLLSLGLLVGVCLLYPTDAYDGRLLRLGLILAGAAHVSLADAWLRFYGNFLLDRQLPLTLWTRWLRFLVAWALLLLPEIWIWVRYFPDGAGWSEALSGPVLLWSWVCFQGAFVMAFPQAGDPRTRIWLSLVFASCIGTMFHVPALVLGMVALTGSGYLFRKWFFRWEMN